MDELSEDDKLIVSRARKIQRFLSQPFTVASQFTGMAGKLVALKDTIEGFEQILAGNSTTNDAKYPEQAFYLVGTIEDMKARPSSSRRQSEMATDATQARDGESASPPRIQSDRQELEIVTPRGRALTVTADEVTAPSVDGEFGVLPGHLPLLAALRTGLVTYRVGSEMKKCAVGPGLRRSGAREGIDPDGRVHRAGADRPGARAEGAARDRGERSPRRLAEAGGDRRRVRRQRRAPAGLVRARELARSSTRALRRSAGAHDATLRDVGSSCASGRIGSAAPRRDVRRTRRRRSLRCDGRFRSRRCV